MRVLLTNDDGIHATGLDELRKALLEVPGIELSVVAPSANQSATARSITTRRPLEVEEIDFGDGTVGYSADGTPVDCVRLAALGLVGGAPELIVSGINHGSNLGDDITYSGTVAAALEGVVLGVPGIAVSQQSMAREMDFRLGEEFDFAEAADVHRAAGRGARERPAARPARCSTSTARRATPSARVPRSSAAGYTATSSSCARRSTGGASTASTATTPSYHAEDGTDFAAIADRRIAVTPLHFDLTATAALEELGGFDLDRLIRPAAEKVE